MQYLHLDRRPLLFYLFVLIPFVPLLSPEKETNLRSFILRDLLPSSVDGYYRYTGSLTTPPCSKVVEWIIFSRPVYLSHSQVCGHLTHTHTRARVHTPTQTAIFSTHSRIPFARSQWITCCPTVWTHRQFLPSSTSPIPFSFVLPLHIKPHIYVFICMYMCVYSRLFSKKMKKSITDIWMTM